MKIKEIFSGVSRNVFLLGVVSFFNDLSSEMIMPVLPLFIESLGGGKLSLGVVGGIRDSLSSILNIFSGYWAGRTGRKKIFVFSGYFTSAVFKFFLGLSATFRHAVIFSSLERVGKGLRTAPRDAIIAESMQQRKGAGFGIHRAMDTFGAMLGSVSVFIMLLFKFSFHRIILVSAALSFISLVPLGFVKEDRTKKEQMKLWSGMRSFPSNLKGFIFISALFALGNFSYMFFVARSGEFFSGQLSSAMPVLLYVLFNITAASLSVPLGFLSDRIGKQKVIMFGYFIFSVVCFGFIFSNSLAAFIILFVLYGVFTAAVDSTQRAFIADLSGPAVKSSALGIYHTFSGLMALPASLIAGLLGRYKANSTFIYGSVMGLICVFLLLIVFRRFSRVQQQS